MLPWKSMNPRVTRQLTLCPRINLHQLLALHIPRLQPQFMYLYHRDTHLRRLQNIRLLRYRRSAHNLGGRFFTTRACRTVGDADRRNQLVMSTCRIASAMTALLGTAPTGAALTIRPKQEYHPEIIEMPNNIGYHRDVAPFTLDILISLAKSSGKITYQSLKDEAEVASGRSTDQLLNNWADQQLDAVQELAEGRGIPVYLTSLATRNDGSAGSLFNLPPYPTQAQKDALAHKQRQECYQHYGQGSYALCDTPEIHKLNPNICGCKDT